MRTDGTIADEPSHRAPARSESRHRPLMAIENVRKVFESRDGARVVALQDVSFVIREREFVSVVGPSGCGKTTLLRILAGLVGASDGRVLLNGEPISGPRRDVGIVFQSPVLLPWRTVLDNVTLPARVLGLDRAAGRERALELLHLVGLDGFASKYPQELSGGMQQRVSIARALLHDPSILLLDEPFGALDAMTRETMNVELSRISDRQHKTAFFITHNIGEAIFLSDRVVVMSPRPGHVLAVLDVKLPRPRLIGVMGTLEFAELTSVVRRCLGVDRSTR